MANTENWLALSLISQHLLDIYLDLNSSIVLSKGNRPVWKITRETIKGEDIAIVDKLQPLLALQKRLESMANQLVSFSGPEAQ